MTRVAPAFVIRPARAADYESYARLVVELVPGDPVPPRSQFELDIDGVFFAEGPKGEALGYAFVQHLGGLSYVRHLVVDESARRLGLGRALLREARARAVAAGSPKWILNVRPENVAAIALYESEGFVRTFRSLALRTVWSALEACFARADRTVSVREIRPEDDARVEAETGLLHGQLAPLRARKNVLLVAERDGRAIGCANFAPWFPGAYPFRAETPEVAFALLGALHPHRTEDETMNVVLEDQAHVAEALLAAGATLRLEIVRMEGPLG